MSAYTNPMSTIPEVNSETIKSLIASTSKPAHQQDDEHDSKMGSLYKTRPRSFKGTTSSSSLLSKPTKKKQIPMWRVPTPEEASSSKRWVAKYDAPPDTPSSPPSQHRQQLDESWMNHAPKQGQFLKPDFTDFPGMSAIRREHDNMEWKSFGMLSEFLQKDQFLNMPLHSDWSIVFGALEAPERPTSPGEYFKGKSGPLGNLEGTISPRLRPKFGMSSPDLRPSMELSNGKRSLLPDPLAMRDSKVTRHSQQEDVYSAAAARRTPSLVPSTKTTRSSLQSTTKKSISVFPRRLDLTCNASILDTLDVHEEEDIVTQARVELFNNLYQDVPFDILWPGFRFDVYPSFGVLPARGRQSIAIVLKKMHVARMLKFQHLPESYFTIHCGTVKVDVGVTTLLMNNVRRTPRVTPKRSFEKKQRQPSLARSKTDLEEEEEEEEVEEPKLYTHATSSSTAVSRGQPPHLDQLFANLRIHGVEELAMQPVYNFGMLDAGHAYTLHLPIHNPTPRDATIKFRWYKDFSDAGFFIASLCMDISTNASVILPVEFEPKRRGYIQCNLTIVHGEREHIVSLIGHVK